MRNRWEISADGLKENGRKELTTDCIDDTDGSGLEGLRAKRRHT
jgi:hypothetical protein